MGRLFAISDIHGYHTEFQSLLNYAHFSIKNDYLISCGDMIDRGREGFKVVEWFRKMQSASNGRIQALFGNHEHMFLSFLTGTISQKDYEYTVVGGSHTINSYKKAPGFIDIHAKYLASLPLTLKIDNIVFCHAKINDKKSLQDQTPYDVLWDYHKEFYMQETYAQDNNIYIFGHTPTYYINKDLSVKLNIKNYKDYNEAIRIGNKICIDCTYFNDKKLCLYDLTNALYYYYDFKNQKCYMKDSIKTF